MAGTCSIDLLRIDWNRYHDELFFASLNQEFQLCLESGQPPLRILAESVENQLDYS
jgi:hypothetical protein